MTGPVAPESSAAQGTFAPSSAHATHLLNELASRGLRHVIVSPGSRSQALALAAATLAQTGAIHLHVRHDERQAGFLALGIARETGLPAAVIVTSGSAVGNLLPAVMEGAHADVPMLILSADRPAELRGIRSSQTTRQHGIFGSFARLSLDAEAPTPGADHAARATEQADSAWRAALGLAGPATAEATPGPAHLNLSYREPLSGAAPELPVPIVTPRSDAAPADQTLPGYLHADERPTVVIAGAGASEAAEAFAYAAGLPLLAEVVSGARYGRQAISRYAELLTDPELGGRIERAVVFGVPSLTRQVPALVQRPGVDTIVVHPGAGERWNPGHAVTSFVSRAEVDPGAPVRATRPWLSAWVRRDRELAETHSTRHAPDLTAARETGYKARNSYARAEVRAMREPITREMLSEMLWQATWPHDRLVLGASRLIRVLDRVAPSRKLTVHSNRGLAGIDGTVSTALGVALASQDGDEPRHTAGITRVLLGDVTLLHDLGALQLGSGEQRPRIQLIVGNDGGGTIFDDLEVAGTAEATAFDRVMLTPHTADLGALAAATGWHFQRASTRVELERAFTAPVAGPSIIEVPLPRRG